MLKKYILIIAVLLTSFSTLFAQNTTSTTGHYTYIKSYLSKPSIEVSYGLSNITLNGSSYGLANAGMIEMKLGFTKQSKSKYGNKILDYRNNFLFLGNASSNSYSKSENPGIENSLWRFGLGNKKGYGVKMGSMSLMPYSSNSFAWSELNYSDNDVTTEENSALADFNDAFRFGSTTEAGLNFQIVSGLSIQPKYEISDIFPRHLFGKQLMSSAIETGGRYLLESFTNKIMKNTPVAGVFVNFILVNAYEYGFYQLRKDQMYWPFTSTAPLRYNTFKLGMTFTF